MKRNLLFVLLLGIIFIACCDKDNDDDHEPANSVKYKVTFTLHWNSQDFPTDYPSNAHFSKLIGWSHKSDSTFFDVGTLATEGIENMAETGGTSPLDDEINYRINKGEGLCLVIGSNLSSGTGEISLDIFVDKEHPSVTLATMIAPSPDWYVAVVGINLIDSGEFVSDKIVTGHVYDAGTDNGTTFTSGNADTNPPQPISLFVDPPLGNGTTVTPDIATVRFSKQ